MDSIENYIRDDVPVVTSTSTLEAAGQLFVSGNVTQISVLDTETSRRPVGIICEHGLMHRCLSLKRDLAAVSVEECMDQIAFVFTADMATEYCRMLMTRHGVPQAPVVDADGRYLGELLVTELPVDP
jgi:CBS domain-containing protein